VCFGGQTCSANLISQTTYSYDQDGAGFRGRPTEVSKWLNTTGALLNTTYTYDTYGNITSMTDPKGNTSKWTYVDSWAANNGNCVPAQNQSSYMTTATNALNQTTSYTYAPCTGQPVTKQDPNDTAAHRNGLQVAYDLMKRITGVVAADGGDTTTVYNDQAHTVETETLMTGTTQIDKLTILDGLGRTKETELLSDPEGVDEVTTTYDPMGRTLCVSNPFRSLSNGSTCTSYDPLSRPTVVTEQDGSSTTNSYTGNETTSTDESGHTWERYTDGLNRLEEVIECGFACSSTSLTTTYTYDPLSDLRSVLQSGTAGDTPRTRSFVYDSLARLTSSANPETGTIGYSYDANGNVSTKTDARNVTTTSTYDALNRLTKKSYSDGVTPTSLFVYDVENITFGTPNFPTQRFTTSNVVGRLSVICVTIPSGCPSMTAYSYDPMGRIIETLNNTPTFPTTGAVYAVSATYDLAGDRTSLTNSTGRTFNYSYDAAGRLQTASNTVSLNGSPVTTPMVSSMTYFPSGQPQTMTTDTGSATITGTWGIDNRLRVTSYQNLSSANTAGTNYGYSLTYMPNSNVLTDAETVYNPASGAMSWSWNFGYDSLNRLTSAQSTGAVSFGCGWTYDGFGNRLTQAPSGTGLSCTSVSTPVNANNQLSNPIYSYDAAGDILTEGGNTLTYDAEGRIITGIGAFGTTTYDYGGDGMRVNKTFGSAATEYIHDPDGALVATYVNGSYFGNFQDMWVAGKHFGEAVVASGNASQTQNFSLNNWLGSLVAYSTPSSGIPNTAYISQPFGDAQTSLFGPNNNDDVHFTGKERDGESGNDYFGARYYASSMGRFMSPDWSAKAEPVPYAKLGDPQTLNLYGYMQNNPLGGVDQDGHCPNTFALGCNAFDNLEGDEENSANQSTPPPSAQQQPAQQQSPYQAGNREANVVYHETAALRPIPGQSDDGDLHDVRVDAAHVYNNVTNKSAFQDTGTLNAREQKDLAGGYPPGVKAYNDSVAAVNEAAHSADSTGGSKHFFVRDTTLGSAQRVPSWANGNQIVYGPFRTTANGDGGISKGDTIYIWINNTR
jgi:RHS repeat-associated protein